MKEIVKILVLEDDPDLREQLAYVLEDAGYNVTTAASGEQAVQLASQGAFDLVVSDIRMDGMSGLDAIEQMRQQQPNLRSLVVTGYSTEADSIRAIQLGVGDYLKKPFRLDAFLDSVKRLVAARGAQMKRDARDHRLQDLSALVLEGMLKTIWGAGASAHLVRAQRARRLAMRLGLSAPQGQRVELAVLLATCFVDQPDHLQQERLEPQLSRLVAQAWEDSEEQLSLEEVCVRLGCGREENTPPTVLSAWNEVVTEDPSGAGREPETARRQRGLLSLARALRDNGELISAASAYDQALLLQPGSQEAVEALLGMANLQFREGKLDGARQLARQAWECSHLLGPANLAETHLEAALLLIRMGGSGGAEDLLRKAGQIFADLGLESKQARCQLALAQANPAQLSDKLKRDLEVLLLPENRDDLSRAAEDVLPFLLLHPVPGHPQLSARLAREFPRLLRRALPQLNQAALLLALSGLSGGALDPHVQEVLQALAEHPDPTVRAAALAAAQSHQEVAVLPLLRVYSLGAFEVHRGEERIQDKQWKSQNARWFLAYLASQGNKPVAVDRIIDLFWPEDAEKGRKNVSWITSIVRKVLRPPDFTGEQDYLLRGSDFLQLNPELPRWHDLDELEKALAEARGRLQAGQTVEAAHNLRRSFLLHRGAYLENCYADWALELRSRLSAELIARGVEVAGARLQQDDAATVVELTQKVLELDNCCQDAYLLSMQALIRLARPVEALRGFEQCRKFLHRELGVEPSIDLLREQQRALMLS